MNFDTPVKALYGVGEKTEKYLHSGGLFTVKDLIYHLPRAYQNRGDIRNVDDASSYNAFHSYVLTIASEPKVAMIRRGMNIMKLRAFDETGVVQITYFNQNYLKDVFTVGATFRFWGKIVKEKRTLCMNSPSYEPILQTKALAPLVPVYPLFSGLNQKQLSKLISEAVDNLPSFLVDNLPSEIRNQNKLCTLGYALRNVHRPESTEGLNAAIRRLTFDELFCFALSLSKMKSVQRTKSAPVIEDTDITPFLSLFPYSPTRAQMKAISEIIMDIHPQGATKSCIPMNRIVVGDVGSGKTLCASAAAYIVCKNGYQCALMAPTEILALQHFEDLCPLFEKLGIGCELLTGSTPQKAKRETLGRLKSGETKLVIGTHALIQGTVEFNNLALAITDEQHRFGAKQRAALSEKGMSAHTLVMSATPIPRTLSFMIYGDLDISLIDEMPPGRKRVSTYVVDEGYRDRLNAFIRKQASEGHQVYIVCPTVEEKQREDMDNAADYDPFTLALEDNEPPLKAAVEYAKRLQTEVFPDLSISFIHGKLKPKDKDIIMMEFASGGIDVLVSTTVIEVGVNVPNATLMIVENAERFGLSQLHQLRGRVGRGSSQSYCVLVSDSKGEKSKERLHIMKTIYDGYTIAEKDLQMRGPGDFFSQGSSIRQSGDAGLDIAKSCTDTQLVHSAFESARLLLEKDPDLSLDEHLGIKHQIEQILDEKASTIN
ncbi:MAG: ATP-dependent DNA helicase RecG [Clostridia bacterium]|nr:ATP-dependent DNA helicase RecG [Clostridia bacterium]